MIDSTVFRTQVFSIPNGNRESIRDLSLTVACMPRWFSRVWLFATPWTVACQAPLSMGFSRQEYWSGVPLPSPGESSRPRDQTHVSCIIGVFLFFTTEPQGKPQRLACCSGIEHLYFCFSTLTNHKSKSSVARVAIHRCLCMPNLALVRTLVVVWYASIL